MLRACGRVAKAQFQGKVFGRPTEVALGTSRFLAEPGRASFLAVYGNPFEHGPMMAWKSLLQPGDLFIDVGANVGAYSLWARQLGASVIAVEADPTVVERLRRNLVLNSVQDIEIVEKALSNQEGNIEFTVGMDATGHIASGSRSDSERTQTVAAITLDQLLGERTVTGIKIDVEGAEALVLKGAEKALGEHRIRAIQLEWNAQASANWGTDRADVADLLSSHGYEFWSVAMSGELTRLSAAPHSGEGVPDIFVLAPGAQGLAH